jgi:GINS complex subunit 4
MHQIEVIEDMNATADPTANFKLVIVQTELERFKFLVRSLLRARIAKVRTFSFVWQEITLTDHILLQD